MTHRTGNTFRSPVLATGAHGDYPTERCQLGATVAAAAGSGPVKMCYLSPFMGAPGAADSRTISESNLSTSGYSSISSPGLSRCNSSSPMIADETTVGAFQRAGQGHLQVSDILRLTYSCSDLFDYWLTCLSYDKCRYSCSILLFVITVVPLGKSYSRGPQGFPSARGDLQQ